MKQTTLCYIDNGDSYLMLHRVKKENDASHGKWIGVGGKCEADESPDECMLREVKEETGLEITQWHYRGIVTFISDTWPNEYMHLFTATAWCGEPDMSIDNEGELAWITKQRIIEEITPTSNLRPFPFPSGRATKYSSASSSTKASPSFPSNSSTCRTKWSQPPSMERLYVRRILINFESTTTKE